MPAPAHTVAVVTCRVLPEPDPDQELLLDALRDAGLLPSLLAWDDPAADPAAFDLCVLRSCWNYPLAPERFTAWCERAAAGSRLLNPLPVVRWNLHKGYLRDLAAAGVPVVPTAWLARGATADLGGLLAERGWGDVVIKPAVSAASYRTRRFGAGELDAAERFLAGWLEERDAMVQPYLPAVETSGERALVWIDSALTHAVRKSPRFSGDDETVSEALPLSAAERALGERTMAVVRERFGGEALYGRVDVVADEAGGLVVAELELVEPSLFLLQHPPALARLVQAIGRRLAVSGPRPDR